VRQLWDLAYHDLNKCEEKLVEGYMRILSRELKAGVDDLLPTSLVDGENDFQPTLSPYAETGQSQMRQLIQNGLARTEHLAKLKDAASYVILFANKVKDMADSAVKAIPQAALPWAGICFALQVYISLD